MQISIADIHLLVFTTELISDKSVNAFYWTKNVPFKTNKQNYNTNNLP